MNSQINSTEKILFDADRDNEGKGISTDQILALLKKIQLERSEL